MILFIILYILFSLVEGVRDGFFYHYKMSNVVQDKYNAHIIFTAERVIVLVIMYVVTYLSFNSYLFSLLILLAQFLMFSFFHNGAYYEMRHFLNKEIYAHGFFDSSKTSTSKIELNTLNRTILFVLGLAIYIIACKYYC